MSIRKISQKLLYWDVYISAIIHGHESLMLTIMLFIPALIFSPHTIAAPIYIIIHLYGLQYAIRYIFAIVISLLLTTFFKRHFKRIRPKPRPQLSLKTMYFRNKETNYSMPSGDCAQAATFLFFFLNAYTQGDIVVILIAILMILNVMLGRVYFCCHYLSDCQVGYSIGITSAFFVNLIFQIIGM